MRFLKLSFILFLPLVVSAQNKTYNITTYGAQADGKTNNTAALQKAIDDASQDGGGRVIVPAGRFVTGPLHLKSGVNLYLSKGAMLLGSDHRRDYGPGSAEPMITAKDQQNISITGSGTIDGQGDRLLKDIFDMLQKGELKDSNWQTYNPWHQKQPEERNRPKLIFFIGCNNVQIKGISLKNSVDWVQDYKECDNLVVDSINVESNTYWNNDGIDIVDCHNVRVTNSFFNADDDGICLKSENRNAYSDQIYIANCKVRSSASGIKFGTASRGGFKHVTIKNVEIYDTYRSAIALESVDGGFLEDIDIRDINARNTGNAIFIRVGHRNQDSVSSSVKRIYIANVKVQIPKGKPDKGYPMEGPELLFKHHGFPCVIAGLPGHPVSDVTLENIKVSYEGGYDKHIPTIGLDSLQTIPEQLKDYPEFSMFGELPAWALYVRHAQNLVIKSTNFSYQKPDLRPACIFDDVTGLQFQQIAIPQAKTTPVIVLKDVKDSSLSNLKLPVDEKTAIKKID